MLKHFIKSVSRRRFIWPTISNAKTALTAHRAPVIRADSARLHRAVPARLKERQASAARLRPLAIIRANETHPARRRQCPVNALFLQVTQVKPTALNLPAQKGRNQAAKKPRNPKPGQDAF